MNIINLLGSNSDFVVSHIDIFNSYFCNNSIANKVKQTLTYPKFLRISLNTRCENEMNNI